MSLQFQRLEAASPRGASNQTAYLRQQYMYWREQCEILTAEPVPLTEKQEVALEERGHIKRLPGRERAITIIEKDRT